VANLGVRSHLEENKHNRIRPEQPLYDINELNGIIPVDHKKTFGYALGPGETVGRISIPRI
jgi:hypothetical protein